MALYHTYDMDYDAILDMPEYSSCVYFCEWQNASIGSLACVETMFSEYTICMVKTDTS